jgi:hypothetical protein
MIGIDLESQNDALLPDRHSKVRPPIRTKRQSILIFFFGGIDNELSYITERVLLLVQNSFQVFFHVHSSTCAFCGRVLRYIMLHLIILP